jgi:hypothetical protein
MATATTSPIIDAGVASKVLHSIAQPEIRALPVGFPTELDSTLAWTGAQFDDETSYVHALSSSHLAEINAALAHFNGAWPLLACCLVTMLMACRFGNWRRGCGSLEFSPAHSGPGATGRQS